MANLTQTAITARRGIRFSIYGLFILLVFRLVLGGVIGIYRQFFPEKPAAPTVAFGKLPSIPFPENRSDPGKLTFTLETTQGGLPSLVDSKNVVLDQAKVYFMPKELPTLTSVEEGLNKGRLLGFTTQGQEVTETLYRFRHPVLPKTLELNVVTDIFSLSYDLAGDPSAISAIPPTAEIGASQIRSYLSSAGLLPGDLAGPITHEFLRVEAGQLKPALSLSDAHLTKVHLFRSPYDGLPSIGPDPREANIWFLVSGSREQDKKILSGEFHYFPIDTDQFATYPIKTTAQAWQELLAGQGFIAEAPAEGEVIIRKVYLANYDPDRPSEFFQPVIVFEGDNFTAYVPAVTAEYYGE